MNFRISTLLFCAIFFYSIKSEAQIPPAGAIPTYYNGGFAGEAGALRISSFSYASNERIDDVRTWNTLGTLISVDQFMPKLRSGFAFTASYEKNFRSDPFKAMSLTISPKFSLKGKITIAPFVDLTYWRYNNALYPIPGITPPVYENKSDANYFKVKTGFLINSTNGYFGISAQIFEQWDYNADEAEDPTRLFTNMKYNFQAGHSFQRTPESDFSFTPQLVISYDRYSTSDSIGNKKTNGYIFIRDINLMFRYKKFIAGVSNNGLALGTGKFKLQVNNMYYAKSRNGLFNSLSDNTFLQTNSREYGANSYSGSISLRYVFSKKQNVKMAGF
jgi:hypothetical protein